MLRPRVVVACVVSASVGFAAAAVAGPWRAGAAPSSRRSDAGRVVFGVHTDQRLVALTFDDGPDPRWTPRVLDMLHAHGASATFFDTGLNATAHPDLIRAEVDAGHEIGDHTWSHAHLPSLSASAIQAEIVKGAEAIQGAGAPAPRLFRPPYGASNDAVKAVAAAAGYRTVWWSFGVEHYANHTPAMAEAVEAMLGRIRPGSIILAHDGGVPDRARTMEPLPLLLGGLEARGYRVVTVEALLAGAASRRAPPRSEGRSGPGPARTAPSVS